MAFILNQRYYLPNNYILFPFFSPKCQFFLIYFIVFNFPVGVENVGSASRTVADRVPGSGIEGLKNNSESVIGALAGARMVRK